MLPDQLEELELRLLTDAVRARWGHDLSQYGQASLRRRLRWATARLGASHPSELIARLLHEPEVFPRFLAAMAVSVTDWFRDAGFFARLRDTVVPLLAANPRIRIWHAGCATGEEVYSTAIVLSECGLLPRCHLYGTDINPDALATARVGAYPRSQLAVAATAYRRAGGVGAFTDHIVLGGAENDVAVVRHELRERITWSPHDLCRDPAFTEPNLIVCRNTLIYLERSRQRAVIELFRGSLAPHGLLALGGKESLEFCAEPTAFEVIDDEHRIYRVAAARDRSAA